MGGETRRTAGPTPLQDAGGRANHGSETKVCPRCGATLFSDMDVCYGCLYDFTSNHDGDASRWYFGTEGTSPGEGPAPAEATAHAVAPHERAAPREGGAASAARRDGHMAPPAPPVPDAVPNDLPPWDDDQLWGSLEEVWDDADASRPGTPCVPAAAAHGTDDPGATASLGVSSREGCRGLPRVTVCSAGLVVEVPVPAAGITIGRDPGCDIVVDERVVSRRHVRIYPCDGGLCARDLGATNPATVGGRQIEGEAALLPGERLVLRGTPVSVVAGERPVAESRQICHA